MTRFVLGGGCFWCLEAVFQRLTGVSAVESGYAGGSASISPDYGSVSTGTTGHAEVVRVSFDETIIPASAILGIFFTIHDPTTINRQGADVGSQYRSIMLYQDDQQKQLFETAITEAQAAWDKPIVTELKPLDAFHIAEDEHQNYFNQHPEAGYCAIVINPKLHKARQAFTKWFKPEEEIS